MNQRSVNRKMNERDVCSDGNASGGWRGCEAGVECELRFTQKAMSQLKQGGKAVWSTVQYDQSK